MPPLSPIKSFRENTKKYRMRGHVRHVPSPDIAKKNWDKLVKYPAEVADISSNTMPLHHRAFPSIR